MRKAKRNRSRNHPKVLAIANEGGVVSRCKSVGNDPLRNARSAPTLRAFFFFSYVLSCMSASPTAVGVRFWKHFPTQTRHLDACTRNIRFSFRLHRVGIARIWGGSGRGWGGFSRARIAAFRKIESVTLHFAVRTLVGRPETPVRTHGEVLAADGEVLAAVDAKQLFYNDNIMFFLRPN